RAGEDIDARIVTAVRSAGRIVVARRGRELVPNAPEDARAAWPGSAAGGPGIAQSWILRYRIALGIYLASSAGATQNFGWVCCRCVNEAFEGHFGDVDRIRKKIVLSRRRRFDA